MGETPTLLTCGICGEKSLRVHNFVACIDALKEALAAARRECEELRTALNNIEEALTDCGYTDYGARVAAIKVLEKRAALAAPADGEEK